MARARGRGPRRSRIKRTVDQLRESDIAGTRAGDRAARAGDRRLARRADRRARRRGPLRAGARPSRHSAGAFVIQVKDPELTGRLLSQLQGLLALGGAQGVKPLKLPGGGDGIPVQRPDPGPAADRARSAGRQVRDRLRQPAPCSRRSSPARHSRARPPSARPRIRSRIWAPTSSSASRRSSSWPSPPERRRTPGYAQAKPYIDALDYLISGSGSQDGNAEVKAVLGVR